MSVRQPALAASRWQAEGVGLEAVGWELTWMDRGRGSRPVGAVHAATPMEHSLAPHPQQRIKLGMPSAFFGSN